MHPEGTPEYDKTPRFHLFRPSEPAAARAAAPRRRAPPAAASHSPARPPAPQSRRMARLPWLRSLRGLALAPRPAALPAPAPPPLPAARGAAAAPVSPACSRRSQRAPSFLLVNTSRRLGCSLGSGRASSPSGSQVVSK